MKFTRISVDPARMGGVPCIRDLRIPVATVVSMVADAMTTADRAGNNSFSSRDQIIPRSSV